MRACLTQISHKPPFPAIDNCLSSWRQFCKLLEMSAVLQRAAATHSEKTYGYIHSELVRAPLLKGLDSINCSPGEAVLTLSTARGCEVETPMDFYCLIINAFFCQSCGFDNSTLNKKIFPSQKVLLMTPCKADPLLHTLAFILSPKHFLLSDLLLPYSNNIWIVESLWA